MEKNVVYVALSYTKPCFVLFFSVTGDEKQKTLKKALMV
jgi:hypothetical protein